MGRHSTTLRWHRGRYAEEVGGAGRYLQMMPIRLWTIPTFPLQIWKRPDSYYGEALLKLQGRSGNGAISPVPPSSPEPLESNGDDPFAFLNDKGVAPTDTTNGPTKQNISGFLKNDTKQTSSQIERGMTGLAIRADQGRNPDTLILALKCGSSLQVLSMTEPQTLPRRNSTIWTVATQCVSVASFFGVVVFFAEALYDRPAQVASDCGWTDSYMRHIGTQVWTWMVADQSRHEWLYSTWSLSLAPRPILWIFVGQDVVSSYRTGHGIYGSTSFCCSICQTCGNSEVKYRWIMPCL